jgi:hypothetical protein
VNACLAVHAKRPQADPKAYLLESRVPQFKAVLADSRSARSAIAWCRARISTSSRVDAPRGRFAWTFCRQFPVPVTPGWPGATARERKRPSLLLLLDGVCHQDFFRQYIFVLLLGSLRRSFAWSHLSWSSDARVVPACGSYLKLCRFVRACFSGLARVSSV